MISFTRFGVMGRLGNQLFQYAFLRTTARRLGVKFYCPAWIGDEVFQLNDSEERAGRVSGVNDRYSEPANNAGFNKAATMIRDGTEIRGYFQTERYFGEEVRSWYRFKVEAVEDIRRRHEDKDFAHSVGISVRLGDFVTTYGHQYYVPTRAFYRKALALVPRSSSIMVFSDDISGAKRWLGDLGAKMHFIDGYEPYEGLYLQSRCRDFICSPSTYAWWGAWLNEYPDSVVIAPKEGAFRPGVRIRNNEYWPDRYRKIPALRIGLDHYIAYKLISRARRGMRVVASLVSKRP